MPKRPQVRSRRPIEPNCYPHGAWAQQPSNAGSAARTAEDADPDGHVLVLGQRSEPDHGKSLFAPVRAKERLTVQSAVEPCIDDRTGCSKRSRREAQVLPERTGIPDRPDPSRPAGAARSMRKRAATPYRLALSRRCPVQNRCDGKRLQAAHLAREVDQAGQRRFLPSGGQVGAFASGTRRVAREVAPPRVVPRVQARRSRAPGGCARRGGREDQPNVVLGRCRARNRATAAGAGGRQRNDQEEKEQNEAVDRPCSRASATSRPHPRRLPAPTTDSKERDPSSFTWLRQGSAAGWRRGTIAYGIGFGIIPFSVT